MSVDTVDGMMGYHHPYPNPLEKVIMWPSDPLWDKVEGNFPIRDDYRPPPESLTWTEDAYTLRPPIRHYPHPLWIQHLEEMDQYRRKFWLDPRNDPKPVECISEATPPSEIQLPPGYEDIHKSIRAPFGSEAWVKLVNWNRREAERGNLEDKKRRLAFYIKWAEGFVFENWGNLERLRRSSMASLF